MERASEPTAGMAFGCFLGVAAPRELLDDGPSIKLGGRAFDVLTALIEAPQRASTGAYRRASSSAFAALRSAVSKPSVNRP
jgi:hypothetical protein